MAYSTEPSTTQEAATTAPRTPAVHTSLSKARPIRVVSMGDGPHGKQVVCEFPDGWQRGIDLLEEHDAWHPLFDNLPQQQKNELHQFAKPAAYLDASGVRKRRQNGVSFLTAEVGRNGGYKKYRWFDVPDEEYGAGEITGYRAAAELLEALQRGYGSCVSVGNVVKEVFVAREESAEKPSRCGAASAFSWVLNDALTFFAKNAKYGPWLDGKVAQAQHTNAHFAQRAEDRKAEFTQRMKEAKAAKKAERGDKDFLALAAEFALHGLKLVRLTGFKDGRITYSVLRFGKSHEFATLNATQAFLVQIGGAA